jgi:hypothetical protein
MVRGHVDVISPSAVVGWAADDAWPDKSIDISIFLNGTKVAQVSCHQPRLDLKALGTLGRGEHGFSYQFSPPLSPQTEARISVRVSETGEVVPGGTAVISQGEVALVSNPVTPPREPRTLPQPADPRALFNLFLLYEEQRGIEDLLARLAFDKQDPEDLFLSVHGSIARPDCPCRWGTYYPRDDLYDLLTGAEFQRHIIPRYLSAFPEKKRMIFVHVPKCAGTDLIRHIKTLYPSLEHTMSDRSWTPPGELFGHLHQLAMLIGFYDHLFVSGHLSLGYYLDSGLVRPLDQIFTIVRHPVDIALSHANYVVTRLKADTDQGTFSPDTVQWLARLGIGVAEVPKLSPGELSLRILLDRNIIQPNSMCHWLGGRDADSVATSLRVAQIEITDTDRYRDWLLSRWGIKSKTRTNQSIQFITEDQLSPAVAAELAAAFSEDIRLFKAIQQGIDASGGTSVFGHALEFGSAGKA